MMTAFILSALVLLYLAFLFLVPVLSRSNYQTEIEGDSLNKKLYNEKLQELEQDLKSGEIEQEDYDEALLELKKQLLQDANSDVKQQSQLSRDKRYHYLIYMIVLLPLLSSSFYLWLGDPDSLSKNSAHPSMAQTQSNNSNTSAASAIKDRKAKTLAIIKKLEERAKTHPNEIKTLLFLARAHQSIAQFNQAAEVYKKIETHFKDDPDFLADYADVLAVVHGGNISGKPFELVQAALAINPKHLKALHMAGTAHYRKAEYQQALGYWKRLYAAMPKDATYAETIRSVIAETEQRLADQGKATAMQNQNQTELATTTAASANTSIATTNQSGAKTLIKGTISVAKELLQGINPDSAVYVFARAANGPKMPLAAIRIKANQLPYQYSLSEQNAMSPTFKLQAGQEVIIVARISKTGDVKPSIGDLQGQSKTFKVGNENQIDLVINQTIK